MNVSRAAAALRDWSDAIAEFAAALEESPGANAAAVELGVDQAPCSWRSRLWTEPPERRIGVEEVAEALGRSDSWVYKHVGPKVESPLPSKKFGGELVFLVGELRAWLQDQEERVHHPARSLRVAS